MATLDFTVKVFVAGGTSGINLGIAEAFAAAGRVSLTRVNDNGPARR